MTNDDSPRFFTTILFGLVIGLPLGASIATVTQRSVTEQKTISYCVEQPKDCKVKYDFYKLENKK